MPHFGAGRSYKKPQGVADKMTNARWGNNNIVCNKLTIIINKNVNKMEKD